MFGRNVQSAFITNNNGVLSYESTITTAAQCQWGQPGIAAGDLNGDENLDYVSASCNGPTKISWNDGTSTDVPHPANCGLGVAVGDVDNDGDLDLVVGSDGCTGGGVFLFRNDGSGQFSYDAATGNLPGVTGTQPIIYGVEIVDLDGDSYMDIRECCVCMLGCCRSGMFSLLTGFAFL